ncbi:MAG: hypothetical protein RIT45_325 [Pseudomonadota bacterium]
MDAGFGEDLVVEEEVAGAGGGVSGAYLDPKTGRVDVGSGFVVDGEALPFLNDIELGKDGKIYAFGSDTLNHVHITRVDPKTGARELVWRRQADADAGDANFPYGQCFSGRIDNAYAGGFASVQYAERAYALGNDGSFYIGWKNDGVGVVNVSADGKTCTIVSRWASNNKTKLPRARWTTTTTTASAPSVPIRKTRISSTSSCSRA